MCTCSTKTNFYLSLFLTYDVSLFTPAEEVMQCHSFLALFICSCLGGANADGPAGCPWEDDSLLKWSEPSTWDSGELPGEKDDKVLIRVPIMLDMVTPALRNVIIVDGGKLGQWFSSSRKH